MKRDQTNRKYFQFDYETGNAEERNEEDFAWIFVLDFSDKQSEPLLLFIHRVLFLLRATRGRAALC